MSIPQAFYKVLIRSGKSATRLQQDQKDLDTYNKAGNMLERQVNVAKGGDQSPIVGC